ncbi:MAG: ABC-F family ATP-binding cassette domain-containing protein, partial [Muribaculaceae bacterium]|nr:ABC-F family ATP-binding cassette domain-containing protein [Muribaculaceae bacterium]
MSVVLQVENLTKSFGADILFSNISFGLDEGDKVGIIAKNGTGKSTLLNILAGQDTPDSGSIIFRNGINVGYLDQNPTFENARTIIDICFEGDDPASVAVRDYENALNNGNAQAISDASAAVDQAHAWQHVERFKKLLSQLKINNIYQTVDTLSGGQLKRAALAKILLNEPQMLILDEPTNHLD